MIAYLYAEKSMEGERELEKIIMHCPMNISRTLFNMVGEFVKQQGWEGEFEIIDEPHRLDHESNLLNSIRAGSAPALYIGHATDFGRLHEHDIQQYFEKITDLPLAQSLIELGFKDERNRFHPITVIPFGVICNNNQVGDGFPRHWLDFHDPKYNGKIRIPDRQRTISKVIEGTMKMKYPDSYEKFIANCTFKGSPIDVVNAVDEGEFQFGMVNIAFSRFSRLKNTRILWMEEGAFCMPQVVAVGKGKYEKVQRLVDYIFSREVQDFFAMQGFISAVSGEIPAVLQQQELDLIWNNWEDFLRFTAH